MVGVCGMYASIRYDIRLWIFGVYFGECEWVSECVYCANARTEQPIHTYVVAVAEEFRCFFPSSSIVSHCCICVCLWHKTKALKFKSILPVKSFARKRKKQNGLKGAHTTSSYSTSVVISVVAAVATAVVVV